MADEKDRDEIVTLSNKDPKIVGTFETTRGALEDVWAAKGWGIATEQDIKKADQLAAEQA